MTRHLRLVVDQADAAVGREPERAIRVVLADDHALMRRSLRLLLDSEPDLEVIAEVADLETVMHHVREHRPHVLVLDLGMTTEASVQAIRRLRREVPGAEIVVLTMEESAAFAQQTLGAGAIAFVLKERSDEDLPEAVRRAARGQHYVSPRLAGLTAEPLTGPGSPVALAGSDARVGGADGVLEVWLVTHGGVARGSDDAAEG